MQTIKEKKSKKEKKSSVKSEYSGLSEQEKLRKLTESTDSFYSNFNLHLERARNFLTFLHVDSWDPGIRRLRESNNKPTLSFNKISPIILSKAGAQRNNSPQLDVRAVDENTPDGLVELRNGLLRQIAYESDSDIAYQTAYILQLEIGWGAIEVAIEYEDDESLKQCIKIISHPDYQICYWDPSAQKPDRSDGDFCGKYWRMTKEDFKRTYGDICPDPQSMGNVYFTQQDNSIETITGCDQFKKEWYKKKIAILSNGQEIDQKEAEELVEKYEMFDEEEQQQMMLRGIEPIKIEDTRERMCYKIKKYRFVQNKILEETDWPGKLLPIIYVEGNTRVIDGELIPIPFVQDVIDTQKMINLYGSEIAYSILMARREQFQATPAQTAGFEQLYRNPQNVQGVLHYNVDPQAPGAPIPIQAPAFNPGLLEAYNACTADIPQLLGTYEESRGEESNAQSGIAIDSRKHASNLVSNLFEDNLKRGIHRAGKVQMELFPHVYTEERDVVIRGVDGSPKTMSINKQNGYQFGQDGEIEPRIENDINAGKFNVEVRVDGSYDMQRQQQLQTLISFAQVYPPMASILPDMIAENSGLENAHKLIERAKTLLPPQILAQEDGKPMPPPQPDPIAQMQQQKMQIEMESIKQKNKEAELNSMIKEQQIKSDQMRYESERFRTIVEAQEAGVNAQVALQQAHASVESTRIKSAAELHKSVLNRQTEEIIHHTTRLKHLQGLVPKPHTQTQANA